MTLYTRRGDRGTTDLANGQRVSKTHPRIKLLGQADSLNAQLGLLLALLKEKEDPVLLEDCELLSSVRRRLFSISAWIACAPSPAGLPKETEISLLEQAIDATGYRFDGFVLPGGTIASAHADIARTACRALEIAFYDWEEKETTKTDDYEFIPPFLNRLSDYLFALGRKINYLAGIKEEKWP